MPRSKIAGSYGNSIFSWGTSLLFSTVAYIPTNSVERFPFFYILSSIFLVFYIFLFIEFLMMATLTSVRWYLTEVLICISH